MNIPNTLRAGDSAAWSDDAQLLPDGSTATSTDWALAYHLRGPVAVNLSAAAEGSGWATTVAVDAGLVAGDYAWLAVLTRSGQRVTTASGLLTVLPDLVAQGPGYDPRSHFQRALADARQALQDLVASKKGVKEYSIAGREVKRYTPAELRELVDYYEGKVAGEAASKAIAEGQGDPRRQVVRFVRVM